MPGPVAASRASRSEEPPAAKAIPLEMRSIGEIARTPASPAYALGSAHAGRLPSVRPGSTRASAPAWYSAWSRCDADHVAAYERANTPIDMASMSSSAERV